MNKDGSRRIIFNSFNQVRNVTETSLNHFQVMGFSLNMGHRLGFFDVSTKTYNSYTMLL